MKVFTKAWSSSDGALVITASMSVLQLSLLVNSSSSATLTGNQSINGVAPGAVTLAAGAGVNLSANTAQSPLEGITMNVVSGTVDVMMTLDL